MVTLDQILAPERVCSGVPAGSRKRILQVLGEVLAGAEPEISAQAVFDRLVARERLGSTGLGEGCNRPTSTWKSWPPSPGSCPMKACDRRFARHRNRGGYARFWWPTTSRSEAGGEPARAPHPCSVNEFTRHHSTKIHTAPTEHAEHERRGSVGRPGFRRHGYGAGGAFQRVMVNRIAPSMPGCARPLVTGIAPTSASPSSTSSRERGARFGVRPSQPYLT